MLLPWVTITIFVLVFVLIVFEVFDKAVLAMMGAILMIILGVLDFHQAIGSIEFETIVLLMAMMLLVEVSRESGIFSWLTVYLARKSRGNPLWLFLLFIAMTVFVSAFLDNVTTIVLMVPITITLVKGMGRDPKPYVIGEVLFSNIGGAMTLIGDPPNIIIGGAADLSFNQFILNLWFPVLVSIVVITGLFVATHWKKHLKPISSDLSKLFVSHLLLQKIKHKFLNEHLRKTFMVKSVVVLVFTLLAFLFQQAIGISVAVIALTGAVMLLLVAAEEAELDVSLKSVEWSTLLFFSGLFVMVAGVERVGALNIFSDFIVSIAGENYLVLLLAILWISGLVSMIINSIPFVTLMIPVILNIQLGLTGDVDPQLLWWALSLGACLGGNGTIVGASANVIGIDLAKKQGVNISFLAFMKYGIPLTTISLLISSAYLAFRVFY
ncbi:MAG: ArsB/NhaD family transporter [Candidatus Peregrinibacteria bacterium]|nr:ArsB/NhaD family transporter [Candidatus Peregrinibacteria bacterium]